LKETRTNVCKNLNLNSEMMFALKKKYKVKNNLQSKADIEKMIDLASSRRGRGGLLTSSSRRLKKVKKVTKTPQIKINVIQIKDAIINGDQS